MKTRPNTVPMIIFGSLIGLPLGLLLALPFPEGSPLKLIFGLGGIVAPSAIMLGKSSVEWNAYVSERLSEYEAAKKALMDNPKSSQLKQDALAKGRLYYGAMRENGSPTIYDETAIMNDINSLV